MIVRFYRDYFSFCSIFRLFIVGSFLLQLIISPKENSLSNGIFRKSDQVFRDFLLKIKDKRVNSLKFEIKETKQIEQDDLGFRNCVALLFSQLTQFRFKIEFQINLKLQFGRGSTSLRCHFVLVGDADKSGCFSSRVRLFNYDSFYF